MVLVLVSPFPVEKCRLDVALCANKMQDVGVCAAVLPPFAIDRDSLKFSIETFQRVLSPGGCSSCPVKFSEILKLQDVWALLIYRLL
jgi:hypothetical protein